MALIKIFIIGVAGILPVMAVFFSAALFIALMRGSTITINAGLGDSIPISQLWHLWPLMLLIAIAKAAGIVVSGAFLGLFSYPFYAWLCRRRRGVILKGKFEIIL